VENRKPEHVAWRQRGGVASTYERSELVTRDRFPSRTKIQQNFV